MAGEVLAEVEDLAARGGGDDLDGGDLADDGRHLHGGGLQGGLGQGQDLDGPLGRRRPEGGQAQVDVLAVVEVVGGDVRGAPRPAGVGADDGGALGAAELELGQEPQPLAVDRLPLGPGQVAAVPAVAEDDGDLVLARGEGCGDVVALDEDAVASGPRTAMVPSE